MLLASDFFAESIKVSALEKSPFSIKIKDFNDKASVLSGCSFRISSIIVSASVMFFCLISAEAFSVNASRF